MRSFILLLSLIMAALTSSAQLIINEVSQGGSGSKEYIELVVVGTRTCAGDSCRDIRGWIIDDNNGWCGAGAGQGIAIGHMRFSNDPNWSCVPYGSIILLYNSSDPNPAITLADDPTDANNDNVYVVPSTSLLLEHSNTTPASPSSLTYVYPATTYTAGGDWSTVGLANTGDAVTIVSPANLGVASHTLAYGNVTNPAGAVVYQATSGGAKNYYLTNDLYTVSASYIVGNTPADETPGAPNTIANTTWINGMLANPAGNVITNLAACILQGNTYNFNGSLLNTSGTYTDTFAVPSGCDSIVQLQLSVITPTALTNTLSGCNAVVYGGVTYTSPAIILDTFNTTLGCDSVYLTVTIQITPANPVTQRDTVTSCQSVVYKGVAYTTSQEITDTIKTLVGGCDSIYLKVYLNVLETPVVSITPSGAKICRGESITLTATAPGTVSWGGFPPGNSITIQPALTAIYTASATNGLNCVGSASVLVEVEDLGLQLTYSPAPAERGSPVTFNTSANTSYDVLQWLPAALFASPVAYSQTIIADKKGWVSVIGKSDKGCVDTASIFMEVAPRPDVLMPNAFSPNGDGLNDYFTPLFTRDYKILEFSIFNRYGQRLYHVPYLHDMGRGWDGTQGGNPCDGGTYYYTFSAEDPNGKIEKMKGDLTLVK